VHPPVRTPPNPVPTSNKRIGVGRPVYGSAVPNVGDHLSPDQVDARGRMSEAAANLKFSRHAENHYM